MAAIKSNEGDIDDKSESAQVMDWFRKDDTPLSKSKESEIYDAIGRHYAALM